MFLSLQIGFSFGNTVDVCADLARILGLDTSSLMMAPKYLNCFTVSSSCPLAVMRDLIVLLLFVIILVVSAIHLFCLVRALHCWLLRTSVRWYEQAFVQRYISSL